MKVTIDSLQPLIGTHGLLPLHYHEAAIQQLKLNNTLLFDFYKIFHNRISHNSHEAEQNIRSDIPCNFVDKFPFFYYYPLFAFGAKPLSSLQKFLADYFDLKCEVKKITTSFCNEPIKLAKNSYLNSRSNTKKNKLLICFTAQSYTQYLSLLTQKRFWDRFFTILSFYYKIEENCIVQFQFSISLIQTTVLKECRLGWNSWLDCIIPDTYKIQLRQFNTTNLGSTYS